MSLAIDDDVYNLNAYYDNAEIRFVSNDREGLTVTIDTDL